MAQQGTPEEAERPTPANDTTHPAAGGSPAQEGRDGAAAPGGTSDVPAPGGAGRPPAQAGRAGRGGVPVPDGHSGTPASDGTNDASAPGGRGGVPAEGTKSLDVARSWRDGAPVAGGKGGPSDPARTPSPSREGGTSVQGGPSGASAPGGEGGANGPGRRGGAPAPSGRGGNGGTPTSGGDGGTSTPGARPEGSDSTPGPRIFARPTAGGGAGGSGAGPMPDEDRHGFVAAFVGGVRREGDRGGSGKRLLAVAAGVVAAVALGAVVVGALGTRGAAADGTKHTEATAAKANPSAPAGRPGAPGTTAPGHPGHPGRPGGTQDLGNFGGGATTPNAPAQGGTSDAKHAPGAGSGAGTSTAPDDPAGSGATNTVRHDSLVKQVTYSAVAGYGCTDSSTHFYAKDADFGQGTSGWLRSSTGGYGGCGDGTYLAEPMSGSNGSYDHSQGVLWRFRYSSQPSAAMCRVSVYVPDNSDIKYVGGNPTHYFLYGDDYTFGRDVQPIGDFTISQVANRGGWVTPDAFEVTSGTVVLTMVNTGVDYTSATRHAHHAAAPVRLSCTQA